MATPIFNIDEQGNESNLLMIGCGPYAQSVYIPNLNPYRALQDKRLFLRTVLEIDSRTEQTRQALDHWAIRSDTIDVAGIAPAATEEERNQMLDTIKREKKINAVLITTEPSAHVAYAQWALRNKLHILMDKPVSARRDASVDEAQAWGLLEDYKTLAGDTVAARAVQPDLAFNVAVQRRYDPDMLRMIGNIREVFEATGQFPTSIEITKADGSWRLPRELLEETYHGYEKGYGILSHSGYHLLDLLSQIISIAEGTPKQIDAVNVTSSFVRPGDITQQLNVSEYRRMFLGKVQHDQITLTGDEHAQLERMGEVDAHLSIECLCKGKVMTVANLHLLHQSLSARSSAAEQDDKYLGAGRTKYESIKIFQGPVAQHEYTNSHATGTETSSVTMNHVMHGKKQPFVTIKNNVYVQWAVAFAVRQFNKLCGWKWKADMPRMYMLDEFVKQIKGAADEKPVSDILSHNGAVSLMAAAYASGARRFNGKNPMVHMPYSTQFPRQ